MHRDRLVLPEGEPITAHEAKCIRIALIFGDPAEVDLPDDDLERAKRKLLAIEREQPGSRWRIISQDDDRIVIGIDEWDAERTVVEPRTGVTTIIFPCGSCGWDEMCEEGCHS